MDNTSYRNLCIEFAEDLNDIGGGLYKAFRGKLSPEDAARAVARALAKLEQYDTIRASLDAARRTDFERDYSEDMDLARERLQEIRQRASK